MASGACERPGDIKLTNFGHPGGTEGVYTHRSPALFSDAESTEDAVEEVVGVDGADHFAQLVQGAAKLQGQKLGRLLKKDNGMCLS
jgi:hypothetical protein